MKRQKQDAFIWIFFSVLILRFWCSTFVGEPGVFEKNVFEFFYFLNKFFITLKIEHFSIDVEGQSEH